MSTYTRLLEVLDVTSHRLIDGYINAQRPGWQRIQLWQWRLCNAYDTRLEDGSE